MTAAETTAESLRLAHASQPVINAFTSIDDEAITRARDLDGGGPPGGEPGPLTGLPIAVKDLIDHQGRVTTNGSAFYEEVAESTAPCVTRLEEAGAVVIGRTGLHEWAFGFSSENPHFGPVRNPWDPDTSVGGSSGGSGAAVAAGIVPIALGTDTGGSVRVPAALCGTYGLKVTHGRIPLEGVFPLVPSIDTVGPLANSIDNIESSYRAMAADADPLPSLGTLKFGVPEPWCSKAPMESSVRESFDAALANIADLGHSVHPIDLPDVEPSPQIWNAISEEVRETHLEFRRQNKPYGADIVQRLDDADAVGVEEIAAARVWQQMVRQRFADAFATVDFLLTPTVPVRRKVIGEDMIGDRHYRSVISYFSAIVNHSLHPAAAAPLNDGLSPPSSIQVIGPRDSELDLIAVVRKLDEAEITKFRTSPLKFT